MPAFHHSKNKQHCTAHHHIRNMQQYKSKLATNKSNNHKSNNQTITPHPKQKQQNTQAASFLILEKARLYSLFRLICVGLVIHSKKQENKHNNI
jgi:hypothetical protein